MTDTETTGAAPAAKPHRVTVPPPRSAAPERITCPFEPAAHGDGTDTETEVQGDEAQPHE